MSEEEILNYLEKVSKEKTIMPLDNYIQGLLDLYTHKKGRVEELKQELLEEKEKNKNSVSKDEIKTLLQDVDNTKFINKHVKGMYLYDNLKCLLVE